MSENPYLSPPLPRYNVEGGFEWEGVEAMERDEVKEEMEVLREAVEHHSELYYTKGRPVISDTAYDRLFKRLEELEEALNVQGSDSPTEKVGEGRNPD